MSDLLISDAKVKDRYAVFDNPKSKCRELYLDGRVVAMVTLELLRDAPSPGPRNAVSRKLIAQGEWTEGRIIGDASAIHPSRRHDC